MKFLILALSLVGFASTSSASILVEPYVGYGLGKYEDGSDKGAMTGTVLGGRIAGETAMLFIGGDYSMTMSGKISPDDNSGDADFDASNLYGVLGVNLPVIRAWVGYGLMNNLTVKNTGGDSKISGGSHIKLGVGLKLIPMLSLNVEYFISDWKKVEIGNLSGDSDLKNSTLLLSASVPFSW